MSGRLLDRVLVIDIEATCWEGEPPPGQENEIIEIGLCSLEVSSGKRLEKRSILVRPESSQISEFCTQLTTLTQEQVDKGISFAEACALLKNEYAARDRVWASYGDYDRIMFEKQCLARQIAYPFGRKHLNVKTLFALGHALDREVGLATALRVENVNFEGTQHRGDDDAWNIAALLGNLLQRIRPQ